MKAPKIYRKSWTTKELLLESFTRKRDDECWPWVGSFTRNGYGLFWMGRHIKPNKVPAHRLLFELRYGLIPNGLLACHTCDNKWCVNPRHVFLGTHQDNCDDRERKLRCKNKGEDHWNSKLSDIQIQEIRKLRSEGITGRAVAKLFSVSPSNVSMIWNRKTHIHPTIPRQA